nr:hypothetical protein [Tanacetum cinerariifolium]
MLQICPRIPNQQFDEQPFKEEILTFLRELGHSGEIKMITDVNINKLLQPWRSFAAVINKCLSGKSTGYDSLYLSQAQILWGMYHKKNMDFAYLLYDDFVYQVVHKDVKKSNKMYYPRFTKVIINFFMTKDQSIPRRNKVNWHFSRDDHMFTTIKLVSRHQNTQQYGAILPIKLTNEAIRNSESYKEYYAIASGAEPPKIKASVRKKQSSSDTTITMPPPTAKGKRLKTSAKVDKPAKEKQSAKMSKAKVENIDDEDNDEDSDGMNVEGDEMDDKGANEENDADELYRDVNINLEGQNIQMVDVQTTHVIEDTHVTLTLVNPEGQQQSSSVSSRFVSNMLNPSPNIAPSPTNVPSSSLYDLPNFGSLFGFEHRVKNLETNFSKFMQTNQLAEAISLILGIVDKYLDHWMNKVIKVDVQLQSNRLRVESQAKNKDFLNKLDENIQKIIKEQVKEQVKVQVSKILPKIEKTVNEQLEAEVLTRSSNSSKTSHAVAAELSELELKKILIDKMESNKSIHKSDEQKNLYKALEKTKNPSLDQTKGPREDEREKNQSQPGHKRQQFYGFMVNRESAQDVYSKRRIIAVTELQIVEWHNYKHLDWITVHRDNDKLYKFKEGYFKRLHIQDIEDMLLLMVKGKLTNLMVNKHFALNVSLRMFTRSIVIQRRVEDLQLGVESYQKKLNLTKPDTYISDLKRKEAYTAYSNPRGFIYQNKDKQNKLMRIDKLHKFSDGTLNDVQTALDDRLKVIRMQYLPQTIWR